MKALQELNPNQREAAEHIHGPLMVIAGAGSGKTKMLTSRIATLILHHKVKPWNILAVTFTNKAAQEMRHRILTLLKEKNIEDTPYIGTFHAIALRMIQTESAFTPFKGACMVLDDADQLSLIKSVAQKLGLAEDEFPAKAIKLRINAAKCKLTEATRWPQQEDTKNDPFERHMSLFFQHYQEALFAQNAVDFGEILCLATRLLRDNPELQAKYRARWKYLHVDEYQDTNGVQSDFLRLLASPRLGGHGQICVVGDEDQAIYGWRGAEIRNILEFEKDYPEPKVVRLEQNYRSTPEILKAAHAVIRHNTSRRPKELWTENAPGEEPLIEVLETERDEGLWFGSKVTAFLKSGASAGDIACFYRTHAQSRQIEDVCRLLKIPYTIVGGLRYYDRKEIKDILAYFRLILNPKDNISFKRVLNTPLRGIGKSTLEKIEAAAGWGSSFETLQQACHSPQSLGLGASVLKKCRPFVALIENLRAKMDSLSLRELYLELLDESGMVSSYRKEKNDEAKARIENLEEFNTVLEEYEESTPEPSLFHFLELTSLNADVDRTDGSQSIRLMTLHAAKGLEFPIVFMLGMEEGLFPGFRSAESEELLEEERRLCYVGMTRAKKHLFFSRVECRRLWGRVDYPRPSRFLSELPESSGKGKRLKSKKCRSVKEQDEHSDRILHHPTYGAGKVIRIEGSGTEKRVIASFKKYGSKKFIHRLVARFMT